MDIETWNWKNLPGTAGCSVEWPFPSLLPSIFFFIIVLRMLVELGTLQDLKYQQDGIALPVSLNCNAIQTSSPHCRDGTINKIMGRSQKRALEGSLDIPGESAYVQNINRTTDLHPAL